MPDGQSELARTIFKAAADSLSLDKVANLTGQDATTLQNKQQSQNGPVLRFTEKEISKMPNIFKQEFRILGILKIKSITPLMCQNLLDDLTIEGKYKTVDEIYRILNTIFKMAIKHGIIMLNPMDIVFHKKHANEHGSSLSKAEEQFLLEETKGTPYQIMFAVALYTGIALTNITTRK